MLRKGSLTGLLLFGIFFGAGKFLFSHRLLVLYRVINFGQLLLGLSFQEWELPL